MIQNVFSRLILLTAIFACGTVFAADDLADYPPRFETEDYLAAREKLIETLMPEERLAAVRILDWMIDFVAEGHCKPEEILVYTSVTRTRQDETMLFVRLDVPDRESHDAVIASPFRIFGNHVATIDFGVEEYIGCGCCYDKRFPEEISEELWNNIKQLSRLKSLEIRKDVGQIKDDAELAHLAGMTQMQWLYLGGVGITDAGLAHLAGMTQMRSLYLNGTGITDAGLAHLAGMAQLQSLDLGYTKITDAGLVHLEGLTQLTSLFLWRCEQITGTGIQKLQDALPKCRISHRRVSD